MSFRNRLRAVNRRMRGRARKALGRSLATVLRSHPSSSPLDPEGIRRVLVVRNNRRIGNTLFLTPLIESIAENFPDASIDILIAFPLAPELLRGLPGVNRVLVMSNKGPSRLRRRIRMIRDLRQQSYDLVIDPSPRSTSGRLLLSLAGAKQRLGFMSEDQWAPLTHAVQAPQLRLHDAQKPVMLLANALGRAFKPDSVRLNIALTEPELADGATAIAQCLGSSAPAEGEGSVYGFFADATGQKKLERSWWSRFLAELQKLDPTAALVEILPTNDTEPLRADIPGIHFASLRELAAAMAACSCFVSADAGPMHLASAVVPTVALFNHTNPGKYRPLKADDLVIDVNENSPEQAASLCVQHRQAVRPNGESSETSAPRGPAG